MAQTFHPSMNTVAKATIFGFVFFVAAAGWIAAEVTRSPYNTQQNVPRDQPVPFSHEHHVAGLGIDCRYCHTSVEEANFAGIPPTKTCMTCHSQIWTNAAILEPVRESWRSNRPLRWTRVHDLPDFVQFNHSIHVNKGIGCQSCHGQVDQMPLMWKAHSLQMEWCLQCHKDPSKYIRPVDQVFNLHWDPQDPPKGADGKPVHEPKPQSELGPELIEKYHVNVRQLTNCSVCHY